MRLNNEGLKNGNWEAAGYHVPKFDREAVTQKTKAEPKWLHFGAGNIFRAFQANVMQNLLNEGICDTGLVVAEGFDYDIINMVNTPHDNLSILVTLKADNTLEKHVIGSIVESVILDSENQKEFQRMNEIFTNPSLQMASFTITEKGYQLVNASGDYQPAVAEDMKNGPEKPASYIGKIASLLYARYQAGKLPIAMVSMDNCSHNGEKLQAAVMAFAEGWTESGLTDQGFVDYLQDEKSVSFPWSMIDKITPRPDQRVEDILIKDGVEDAEPVITGKRTYVASFVNAEECEYLVVEDKFPNGRLPLEKGGVIFTDRETVEKVERMKVCTCLNPLHTALAIYGCLMGYELISEEMKNPVLKKLVERIGYQEGLPVVTDPGILKPQKFIDEVVNLRIPNPFMPDTPQRIATDTSQKLAIRFGETIKAYQADDNLKVEDLKMIPLVYAGWFRYLMGVDDSGKAFELSADPMLDTICPAISALKLGEVENAEEVLKPFMQNPVLFGVDLYEAGLAEQVLGYFKELAAKPGAVGETLAKYVMAE
ncbi:MAG TPA: mannitol dehydrogenase family protein [Candidatus Pelethocola excrementipullorum]|nr:mannitol dehydrogenase family protein [Candidatus Pelethocola excrementipullorum]